MPALRHLPAFVLALLIGAAAGATDPITLYNEGARVGTINKINCVGGGVTCSTSENQLGVLTIAGWDGGLSSSSFQVAPVSVNPNANGMSWDGGSLNLEPADDTHSGALSHLTQVIGGSKVFDGGVYLSTLRSVDAVPIYGGSALYLDSYGWDFNTASSGSRAFNFRGNYLTPGTGVIARWQSDANVRSILYEDGTLYAGGHLLVAGEARVDGGATISGTTNTDALKAQSAYVARRVDADGGYLGWDTLISSPRAEFTATGTVTMSGTTVTGTGTAFTSEVRVGDRVAASTAPSTYAYVTVVTDATHITTSASIGSAASQTLLVRHAEMLLRDSTPTPTVLVTDHGLVGVGTVRPTETISVVATTPAASLSTGAASRRYQWGLSDASGYHYFGRSDVAGQLTFTPAATTVKLSAAGTGSTAPKFAVTAPSGDKDSSLYLNVGEGGGGGYIVHGKRLSDDLVLYDQTEFWGGPVSINATRPAKAWMHVQGAATALNVTGTLTSVGTAVTGSGTSFGSSSVQNAVQVGDQITCSAQTKTVSAIGSSTSLTVSAAFSPDISGATCTRSPPLFRLDNSAGTAQVTVDPTGAATFAQVVTGVVPTASAHLATKGYVDGVAGGAPTTAKYITQEADATLSAEQSLGALTTGLTLNTVTGSTGVLSTYAGSSCGAGQVVLSISASGVVTCGNGYAQAGAAGGSTTQLQYNNAGALGGISQWTSDGSDVTVAQQTTAPSAPSAGLKQWVRKLGLPMQMVTMPGGEVVPMMPIIGFGVGSVGWRVTTSGGTGNYDTPNLTATGSVAAQTASGSGIIAQSAWVERFSSSAAGSSAGQRQSATPVVYRGDSAGLGGFLFWTRFIIKSSVATQRSLNGLVSVTGDIGNTEPSAQTDCVFVGNDTADANLSIMYNDSSGTASKDTLGASFPAQTSDAIYDLYIYSAPHGSTLEYAVQRLDSAQFTSGTLSSNLPTNTTFLYYQSHINNGATAATTRIWWHDTWFWKTY